MANITYEKAKAFALRILALCDYLNERKLVPSLVTQMVRSGTSVGANLAESVYASSSRDFINKLRISCKECNETLYWLELLEGRHHITKVQYESMVNDCSELLRIMTSIINTTEGNMKRKKAKAKW